MGDKTWHREQLERCAEERRRAFDSYERSKLLGNQGDRTSLSDEERTLGETRAKLFDAVPCIEGERIVLDKVVESDADALRDLVDNPRVARWIPTYLFERTHGDVYETIRLLYGEVFLRQESLIMAVRVRDTGELAGLAEFYGLRDSLHKVSVGYRLRECCWGRGYATEAVGLMVGYLYGKTDIEIITASVLCENRASAHVLEKCGFIRTAQGVEEDWGFEKPAIVDKFFC